MTNKEKQEAENICGMIEEIKKGIVNAVKKCSQTEASAADLYAAMMMATADFISAYSKSTGLSRWKSTKRFTQMLPSLVADINHAGSEKPGEVD